MPHNGPRGSPLTEDRHAWPAIAIAMATVAPTGTETVAPFTVNVISLGMNRFFRSARGQIRFDRNFRSRPCNLIHENSGGC
jgi:hypothetical protein